jgi:hypothetical protein
MDVENGIWAIYGSRMGTHMTMLSDWDHTQVQSFDYLNELWDTIKWKNAALAEQDSWELGDDLYHKLGLPSCTLTAQQSKFFKRHYNADKYNLGPLVREMDIIRQIEGW